MEVHYRREINHNYMILNAPNGENGYECRMLAGNSIEGLLKFRIRYLEEGREFYYEITSRQPLSRILEKRRINGEEIRQLLQGILAVLGRIDEYLLREEQLLLEPEYIYLEPDCFQPSLCLLPGFSCDLPTALSALLQYLLERVDHQDRDAVVIAYHLYHESLKENYGRADLLRCLSTEEDPIFKREDREEQKETQRQHQPLQSELSEETAEIRLRPVPQERIRREENSRKIAETKRKPLPRRKKGRVQKVLLLLLTTEGLLYYITGMEGIKLYGIAAAILWLAVILLVWNGERAETKEQKVSAIKELSDQTEQWDIKPECEEDYRRAVQQEAERQAESGQEEGTALLTDLSGKSEAAVLTPLSGEGQRIEITQVPFVIGKHPELTDFCIRRASVSRLHLRIDQREGVYIATDLNSTNGTVVNGYLLQANETVSIKNGDSIYISDLGFKFSENSVL